MGIADPMNASIQEFEQLFRKEAVRQVRVLKDMPGALWVKFHHYGLQRCRYFEDNSENRRILESIERSEPLATFPMRPRVPKPAVA